MMGGSGAREGEGLLGIVVVGGERQTDRQTDKIRKREREVFIMCSNVFWNIYAREEMC